MKHITGIFYALAIGHFIGATYTNPETGEPEYDNDFIGNKALQAKELANSHDFINRANGNSNIEERNEEDKDSEE